MYLKKIRQQSILIEEKGEALHEILEDFMINGELHESVIVLDDITDEEIELSIYDYLSCDNIKLLKSLSVLDCRYTVKSLMDMLEVHKCQ